MASSWFFSLRNYKDDARSNKLKIHKLVFQVIVVTRILFRRKGDKMEFRLTELLLSAYETNKKWLVRFGESDVINN